MKDNSKMINDRREVEYESNTIDLSKLDRVSTHFGIDVITEDGNYQSFEPSVSSYMDAIEIMHDGKFYDKSLIHEKADIGYKNLLEAIEDYNIRTNNIDLIIPTLEKTFAAFHTYEGVTQNLAKIHLKNFQNTYNGIIKEILELSKSDDYIKKALNDYKLQELDLFSNTNSSIESIENIEDKIMFTDKDLLETEKVNLSLLSEITNNSDEKIESMDYQHQEVPDMKD